MKGKFRVFFLGISEAMAYNSCAPDNSSSNRWRWTLKVWFFGSLVPLCPSLLLPKYFQFSHLYVKIKVHYTGRFSTFLCCRYPYVENTQGLPERTNEAAGEYANACIAVAAECGIPVIDLWTKMQQCPTWRKEYLRYLISPLILFIFLNNHFFMMWSFFDCKTWGAILDCSAKC